MFLKFLTELKQHKIPVSLGEFLTFLDATQHGLADYDVDSFYYLARLSLIKDEKNIDKFDRVFSSVFGGAQSTTVADLLSSAEIPRAWIEKLSEKILWKKKKRLRLWVDLRNSWKL